MAQLEEANLGEKGWTMRGEVSAVARPKNSVLAAELDFQHTTKSAPVITAEVAASLEDMIKSRITESRFDDPVKPEASGAGAPR